MGSKVLLRQLQNLIRPKRLFAGTTIAAGGQLVGRYAIHFVAMGTYQVSNVSHDEQASDWLMVEIIRAREEKSSGTKNRASHEHASTAFRYYQSKSVSEAQAPWDCR